MSKIEDFNFRQLAGNYVLLSPDDVGALLFKEGVQMEKVWVRTSSIINGKVAGYLLNQPNSPLFGLNQGDVVTLVSVPTKGRRFTMVETPDIYS